MYTEFYAGTSRVGYAYKHHMQLILPIMIVVGLMIVNQTERERDHIGPSQGESMMV